MISMTLAEIAAAVTGECHGDPQTTVTGPAFIDSRQSIRGGLFVAVVGDRADGHDFAVSAFAGGAAAVLGTRPTAGPTVMVADPVAALGRLARHVIDRLPGLTVCALTGSQGKTGTKDYLATILAARGEVVATRGNHNNEIGVPLTVLRVTDETRHLVVEMGARGLGHVRYLCGIAPPRVAAVLNVGVAHLSEFGTREAIAEAKGELVAALPRDGVACLNADDPATVAMAERTSARVLWFGESAEVGFTSVRLDEMARPSFVLTHGPESAPVTLRTIGRHQVANATAAAAMAIAVGLTVTEVAERLSTAVADSPWRMEPRVRADGLLILNDAYNANPASMTAALGTLAALGEQRSGRTVAVLGEMRELGEAAVAEHRGVGETLAGIGIDVVLTVGDLAAEIGDGARQAGWSGDLLALPTREAALDRLRDLIGPDDVVLLKASRGAALEWIADGLADGEGT